MIWTVVLWAHLCSATFQKGPVNVTFIAIGSYRYSTAVPALEAAVGLINRDYDGHLHVKLNIIFPSSIFPCEIFADSIVHYASKFYYGMEKDKDDKNIDIFLGPSK
ncbi:hypothetical protein BV898_02110 [Hypsibius exemplaris]|uniref:Receptor ligand binding region domain-containing protein n=1 Tax=Hypsibius exemplaris TaxID=2072580 RepID=A0A1W0X9S8_HYPEX|nr:hypothetical protein BV898_02110 [Hypsibius exemplaris]